MEQIPESTEENNVEEMPSKTEELLKNKTVILSLIVFLVILVAICAGALIGISAFRKSQKVVVPVPSVKQVAAQVQVYKPMSSADRNLRHEIIPAKKEEQRVPDIKRKVKKVAKNRKHAAPDRLAAIPQENPEKTLQAAKEGNAEAQYKLGVMYSRGVGVKKDTEQSVRWYRRAASQGHAKAQEALEFVYE